MFRADGLALSTFTKSGAILLDKDRFLSILENVYKLRATA
jgi:hypothetical protein